MTVVRLFEQCPPELLPRASDDHCGAEDCDLQQFHQGECAEVSLSGLVLRTWATDWSGLPDWWDGDCGAVVIGHGARVRA